MSSRTGEALDLSLVDVLDILQAVGLDTVAWALGPSDLLTARPADTPVAVIIVLVVCGRQGRKRTVVSRADDLIDLAVPFLIVEIVNFHFVYVSAEALTVHVAGMSSHFVSFRVYECL